MEIKSNISWDRYFLNLAYEIAKKSKDPSTKVGCVIVKNNNVVSVGYNGFPKGVKDYEERYNDRDMKYLFVCHAEANAVYSAAKRGVSLEGSTIYVPWHPCHDCSKAISQSGLSSVVLDPNFVMSEELKERWKMQLECASLMFQEAGITVRNAV